MKYFHSRFLDTFMMFPDFFLLRQLRYIKFKFQIHCYMITVVLIIQSHEYNHKNILNVGQGT